MHSLRRMIFLLIVLCLPLFSIAQAHGEPMTVVATTSIIADIARAVGGEDVTVTSLIPPGADAHAYEPTPQDLVAVAQADVVLAVGAGYEAFLEELITEAAGVPVVEVNEGVTMVSFVFGHDDEDGHEDEHAAEAAPETTPEAKEEHGDEHGHDEMAAGEVVGIYGVEGICEDDHAHEGEEAAAEGHAAEEGHDHKHGACDPHTWTDPQTGIIWARNIAAAFSAVDPEHAADYATAAADYARLLTETESQMRDLLAVVPEERRLLISNHEFMSYFARAFGFQQANVIIPGGTSLAEVEPRRLADLVEEVRELQAPALFAEASANPELINTLSAETGVQVVTVLSESLTEAGGVAPTYVEYLLYNARTIAEALSR